MDFFNIISLLGGLAFFLYGMTVMSNGLEHISGGRLETTLEKMTGNVIQSVLLGMIVTMAVQSSSATTVIIVGLVNAGVLKLKQAIGIIMGANIGTTITAHILRLSDLEGTGSFLLNILKPSTLAPVAAIIGILLMVASKRQIRKDIGEMLLGFSVLFSGMFAMEAAVKPLQSLPEFQALFSRFSNPVIGVLVGTVVTVIIQSSSASVGILQALASTGAITCAAAFPIIMGQNIGTCITPMLASIGASKGAKRTALVHVMFNVVSTVIFLIILYTIQYAIGFPFWNDPITRGGIANFHSIFNIAGTLMFLPFTGLLEKMAYVAIRKSDDEISGSTDVAALLDERFLGSPSYAIQQAREAVITMAKLSLENYDRSVSLIRKFDTKQLEQARDVENLIDKLQSRVDMYLLKLTSRDLTESENRLLSEVLQVVNEFERIGDHDDNICDCAENMHKNGAHFSESANQELDAAFDAVHEIVTLAVQGYDQGDVNLAHTIEPLEEVIDILVETLKVRHSDRLQTNHCKMDAAFPFIEILYNLERIADHCSNVGVHIISYSNTDQVLDRHEYLRQLHRNQSVDYKEKFEQYDRKYFDRIGSAT